MNWITITVDQDELVRRAVEALRGADPRNRVASFERHLSSFRSALARGTIEARLLEGEGYAILAAFRRRRRGDGYVMCVSADSQVAPRQALDETIRVCEQFAAERDVAALYAFQPKWRMSPLMEQLYALAQTDPRLERTVLAEMGDATVLKLAAATPAG